MKKPRVATPGLPFHIDHARNMDDTESAARNQDFLTPILITKVFS
jgi:hypothetical protein